MAEYPNYSRVAQTLLRQQGEINDMKAKLARIRALAEGAHGAGGIGCLAPWYDAEGEPLTCEGNCGGHRTTGWTLDPDSVLAVINESSSDLPKVQNREE